MPPRRQVAAPKVASKHLMPVLLKRAELQDAFVKSLPCKWNKLGKEPSIRLQRAFHRVANVLFNLPPMPHDPESYSKALEAQKDRKDAQARLDKQALAKQKRDELFKKRAKESAAKTGFEAPKGGLESSFLNSLKRPENRIKVEVLVLTPEQEEQERWAKRQEELEAERAAMGLSGGNRVFSAFADKDSEGVDEVSGGVARDQTGYGMASLLDSDAAREQRFKEDSERARQEAAEAIRLNGARGPSAAPQRFRVGPKGKESAIVAKIKKKEGYKMNGKDSMGRNPLDVNKKKRGSLENITGTKIASMTQFLTADGDKIMRHKQSKGHSAPQTKAGLVKAKMKQAQKSMVEVKRGYNQNTAFGVQRDGLEGGPAWLHGAMAKEDAEKLCYNGKKLKSDGTFLVWEISPPELYGLSMIYQKRVTHHRIGYHPVTEDTDNRSWNVNGKLLGDTPHQEMSTLLDMLKKPIDGWPQVLTSPVRLGDEAQLPQVMPTGSNFENARFVTSEAPEIMSASKVQGRLKQQQRAEEEERQAAQQAAIAAMGLNGGGVFARKEKEAEVFDAFASLLGELEVEASFGGIGDGDDVEAESNEDEEFEVPMMYQLLAQQWQ